MVRRVMVLAALAGLGMYVFWPASDPGPGIDPMETAALTPGQTREFAIANLESKISCEALRGAARTSRSLAFDPKSGCDEVWPGLSEARNWTENEDGSVILSKDNGEAVLTIAPGDGVDYEALDPDNAIITVTRLR